MQFFGNPASRPKTKTETRSPSQGVVQQYPVPGSRVAGKISMKSPPARRSSLGGKEGSWREAQVERELRPIQFRNSQGEGNGRFSQMDSGVRRARPGIRIGSSGERAKWTHLYRIRRGDTHASSRRVHRADR